MASGSTTSPVKAALQHWRYLFIDMETLLEVYNTLEDFLTWYATFRAPMLDEENGNYGRYH